MTIANSQGTQVPELASSTTKPQRGESPGTKRRAIGLTPKWETLDNKDARVLHAVATLWLQWSTILRGAFSPRYWRSPRRGCTCGLIKSTYVAYWPTGQHRFRHYKRRTSEPGKRFRKSGDK